MKLARVGIYMDRETAACRHRYGINTFGAYAGEILSHAGIAYEWIGSLPELNRSDCDVVIVAFCEDNADSAEALWRFAERGGLVIAYGGLQSLALKLGCFANSITGTGYAWLPGDRTSPLRYLEAQTWDLAAPNETSCINYGTLNQGRPDGVAMGTALQQFSVGTGVIDRWAVSIPDTVVRFQQGFAPVFKDGTPARDGSGAVDDGILKADDGCAMDWDLDRLTTDTGAPYFAHPYADLWREAMIRHLLTRVVERGLILPFIDYWPEGVNCVAMISHDSDLNIDESAEATLEVLRDCGIQSTWCMIEPGYSPGIYERVKGEGHELAFHYNALNVQGGRWGEEEFDRQFTWLKQAIAQEKVTSNKNHYTRFEGWGELFEWCEKHGIEADQTRGPSKRGNVGFLFGTCHPYFPISWADTGNRMYDVLEVGFLTQDLDHKILADSSVIAPFLEQVNRVRGVAHFLFHQVHIFQQEPVNRAIRKVVAEGRKRGFAFWTCKEINDWERVRRKLRVNAMDTEGRPVFEGQNVDGRVVVWVPVAEAGTGTELRFGVPCRKIAAVSDKILQ